MPARPRGAAVFREPLVIKLDGRLNRANCFDDALTKLTSDGWLAVDYAKEFRATLVSFVL